MRVLHVVNYGWPAIDGYTVRTSGLVDAQSRHLGYDTRVAVGPFPPFTDAVDPQFRTAAWGPEQIPIGEALVIERPGIGLAPHAHRSMVDDLVTLGRTWRPDVIHAHHPHVIGAAARDAAAELEVPWVYEVRCFNGDYDLDRRHPWFRSVRGPRYNQLEYRRCQEADAVVTISQGLARRIRGQGISQVHVVRNSVDVTRFRPPATAPDAGRLRIGYATRFEPIEALDGLVRALDLARSRLPEASRPDVVLAGTGREWPAIEQLRRDLSAESWLSLPGFVPYHQMPELLADLDLFVVPRRHAAVAQDTTPLKPLEALACGVPVLSTDLPALRELLGDNPAVRFCPPTTEGLAAAIAAAVDDPLPRSRPEQLERSWRREIPRYEEVYRAAAKRWETSHV
ncbi:glycosyltransferase [Euzebya tangerina]|uniref:glycosyltransferase n=1 Tax=Euzebya tangerina TaxID=591198 RepID=UPI000E31E854|nr:glycosyltransferase [Euzebya tangerina]